MAVTSVTAPASLAITTTSATLTYDTGTITVTSGTSGYYYRFYIKLTGYSTALYTNNYGSRGSTGAFTWSGTNIISNSDILTGLASATAFTWYIECREYTSSTAYTDGTPYNTTNSSTSTVTIDYDSLYSTATSVSANYDSDAGGSMTANWTEPSSHAGWRARAIFYLATNTAGDGYGIPNTSLPIAINSGSAYSGTSGAATPNSARLAMIRNLTTIYGQLYVYAEVITGWSLNGTVSYGTKSTFTSTNRTVSAFTVPATNSGTNPNSRYDKIKYWNGASWVSPTQVKVWNGSIWEDYGLNSDYTTTKQIKAWSSGAWTTYTKQGALQYDTAAQALDKSASELEDDNYAYTYTTQTLIAYRYVATYPVSQMLDTVSTSAASWIGTSTVDDSTADYITILWAADGPRWIEKMRFKSTLIGSGTPKRIDVKFLKADKTWDNGSGTSTGIDDWVDTGDYTTLTISTDYGANAWGDYFTVSKQIAEGYIGLKFRTLNNETYKATGTTVSVRIGEVDLHLGTITQNVSWT